MGQVQIDLHHALYTDRKCCQERSQFRLTSPSWDLSEEVSPLGAGGWPEICTSQNIIKKFKL